MMGINDIMSSELVTHTSMDGTSISVRIVGSAEGPSTDVLGKFLREVHDMALGSKIKEVVVDLRGLEFMTSSCFKMFVGWMSRLEDAPREHQYPVRFLYDERRHWQNRSLGALACFAVDLIRLETA